MIPQIEVPIAIAYSVTVITVVVPMIKQGATVTKVSAVVDLVVPDVAALTTARASISVCNSQILFIKNCINSSKVEGGQATRSKHARS